VGDILILIKHINIRHTQIVYQQAVILTKDMMSYLHNICVNTLILSENEIVAFERDSLLAHKYPQCFNNIALSGNRFPLSGKNIGDLVRFSVQVVNLTTFVEIREVHIMQTGRILNYKLSSRKATSQIV
jgi:hypothetical protein